MNSLRQWAVSLVMFLLIVAPAAAQFDHLTCENVDAEIAKAMDEAKQYFARANELAKGLKDKGVVTSLGKVVSTLNPIPTSGSDLAENGFWWACGRVIGGTITAGLEATKKALEISAAIGESETGALQAMVRSNRTSGHKRLQTAHSYMEWKQDCPCPDDTPPADEDPVPGEGESGNPGSVTTPPGGGSGGGPTTGGGAVSGNEIFTGGGLEVKVIDHNKAEITTNCPADDKRIQVRSTGTWSTKSTGQDSVTVDGFNVGARYQVRVRCNFQYGEPIEFTFPTKK